MGNSNGIITAPINLETDVYNVLGIGKQGGFYDIGYACSNAHGKINRWAKYKPFRNSSNNPQDATDNDRRTAQFGLEPRVFLPELTSANLPTTDYWEYLAPRVNQDFFRMSDWIGYRHTAKPPFNTGLKNDVEKIQRGTEESHLLIYPNWVGVEIFPADFPVTTEIGSCYFCAIVFRPNGTVVGRYQSAKKVAEFANPDDMVLDITTTVTGSGQWQLDTTYKVYCFLSPTSLDDGDPSAEGEYKYPLPLSEYKNPFNLTLKSSTSARFAIAFDSISQTRTRDTSVYAPWDEWVDINQMDEHNPVTGYYGLCAIKFQFTSNKVSSLSTNNVRLRYKNYAGSWIEKNMYDMYVAEIDSNVVVRRLSKQASLTNGRDYIVIIDFGYDSDNYQLIQTEVVAEDNSTNANAGNTMEWTYVDIIDSADDYPVNDSEVV